MTSPGLYASFSERITRPTPQHNTLHREKRQMGAVKRSWVHVRLTRNVIEHHSSTHPWIGTQADSLGEDASVEGDVVHVDGPVLAVGDMLSDDWEGRWVGNEYESRILGRHDGMSERDFGRSRCLEERNPV